MKIIVIGFVIIAIIVIAIMYAKMILIYRDVQLQIHEKRINEWGKVNKLYLKIVNSCGEDPINNVTYEQMQERIRIRKKSVEIAVSQIQTTLLVSLK
jgi:hypothetical protein